MGMDIDKSRRNNLACRVYAVACFGVELPGSRNRSDQTLMQIDVGRSGRSAQAIDELPIAYHAIVLQRLIARHITTSEQTRQDKQSQPRPD